MELRISTVLSFFLQELLKEQIIQELRSWNDTLHTTQLPTDATELSYWVAQNLPLDNAMRMHLLGVTCHVHRMRSEIAIMKKVRAWLWRGPEVLDCHHKVSQSPSLVKLQSS